MQRLIIIYIFLDRYNASLIMLLVQCKYYAKILDITLYN